jgi:hypothetical protein
MLCHRREPVHQRREPISTPPARAISTLKRQRGRQIGFLLM